MQDYILFHEVEDFGVAKELLDEYNDFLESNKVQYYDQAKKLDFKPDENTSEKDLELFKNNAEKRANEAVSHFKNLFNGDLATGTLVGMKIDWDSLQQIIIEELNDKPQINIQKSVLNTIAPRLKIVASVLLFAEYMVTKLEKFKTMPKFNPDSVDEIIKQVKNGFLALLQGISDGDNVDVLEFTKSKNLVAKLKTPEAVLDFCGTKLAR